MKVFNLKVEKTVSEKLLFTLLKLKTRREMKKVFYKILTNKKFSRVEPVVQYLFLTV